MGPASAVFQPARRRQRRVVGIVGRTPIERARVVLVVGGARAPVDWPVVPRGVVAVAALVEPAIVVVVEHAALLGARRALDAHATAARVLGADVAAAARAGPRRVGVAGAQREEAAHALAAVDERAHRALAFGA